MTAPIPQTVASELLHDLEQMFSGSVPPGEFAIRQLERRAQPLARVDAEQWHMICAGIAALRWDLEKVKHHVGNSVLLNKGAMRSHFNAALTYKHVNLIAEACDFMADALALAPMDPHTVIASIEVNLAAGRLRKASEIETQALARGVDLAELDEMPSKYFGAIEALGIDEARLQFELNAAHAVLGANRSRARVVSITTLSEPDGGEALVVSVAFVGTLDEEIRLEARLASLLAEEEGWNPSVLAIELEALLPEHADQTD